MNEFIDQQSEDNKSFLVLKRLIKIAIIVPFRDLHVQQHRSKQLQEFIPTMRAFLATSAFSFKIFVIEQSSDGRKFNRGKLLNIGYALAKSEDCNIFIFHDVDLIPSNELLRFYTKMPFENPIHIARIWDRYNKNESYFGGIVSFNFIQFENINGFPNNFWGWGGEDDELYKRITEVTPSFKFEMPLLSIT
jgi:predicted glycosyltransferase involved in capsule biosynthesis